MTGRHQFFSRTATLLLVLCLLLGCAPESNESTLFQQARQQVHTGDFAQAIASFHYIDSSFPNSEFASRSSFLVAKSYMGLGNFESAKKLFTDTILQFPDSLEAKKSAYKLAEIDLLEGKTDVGRAKLKAIIEGPGNPYMPEAVVTLKQLKTVEAPKR